MSKNRVECVSCRISQGTLVTVLGICTQSLLKSVELAEMFKNKKGDISETVWM